QHNRIIGRFEIAVHGAICAPWCSIASVQKLDNDKRAKETSERPSEVSKIATRQIVGASGAPSVYFGCSCVDQITIRIEGAQETSFVESHAGLNSLQRVIGYKEGPLHRCVV